MGDSGAVASPDSSGESGGTGDARAAAEDVAALSSEGESGVVGRSTASVKSCVLVPPSCSQPHSIGTCMLAHAE